MSLGVIPSRIGDVYTTFDIASYEVGKHLEISLYCNSEEARYFNDWIDDRNRSVELIKDKRTCFTFGNVIVHNLDICHNNLSVNMTLRYNYVTVHERDKEVEPKVSLNLKGSKGAISL